MKNNLKNYFYPDSICIAGASSKKKSIGYEILRSIKDYGYKGRLFPVNPSAKKIMGYHCFSSVDDIKDRIDLAIIVVPKKFVEETIEKLLDKKVKSIILITAGFRETGKKGEAAEKRILDKVKAGSARLVGPNCMGVINTLQNIKLNATFVAEKPSEGSVAFLSQSGAIGAAVLNSLRDSDVRFAHFISVGNKADISENDLLDYWQADRNIKSIALYLEDFADGEIFLKKFLSRSVKKPVIVLKGGVKAGGIKAAASHTGALGTNDRVVDTVMKQFGIIRAKNLNELFNIAKGFESQPAVTGNRVAIVTNAGGPAILAVDALENEGLILAELSRATKSKLRENIHTEGSVNNPVDLLPGADAGQYKFALEQVLKDKNVDSVISIFVEPVMVNAFGVIETINQIRNNKPLFQVVMPLPEFWQKYRKNSVTKKPLFRNPEDPAKIISSMNFFSGKRNESIRLRPKKNINISGSGFLEQVEVKKILDAYKLPVSDFKIISYDDLKEPINISFPLAVKGISKEIIHKSDLDVVKLNIRNADDLIQSIEEIKNKLNHLSDLSFLIQPYIHQRFEILLGGFRDNSFGPVIMFGTGGKYVEIINDTCLKSAYVSDTDIEELIHSTKIGRILGGVRGEAAVNMTKLKSIIRSSARMLLDNGSIKEFDFNPLIISTDYSFHIVDARIKVG